MKRKKRILCICQKGNFRSVALAYILKKKYKCDAIAIGAHTASKETMAMLSDWADRIVLTSSRYLSYVPYRHKDKLKLWHVGRDR